MVDVSGGPIEVEVQPLVDRAALVRELAGEALQLRARLARIDGLVTPDLLAAAGLPAVAAGLEDVLVDLLGIEQSATGLSDGLQGAAEGYTWVERSAALLGRGLSGLVAAGIGKLLPGMLLSGLGIGAVVLGGIAVLSPRATPPRGVSGVGRASTAPPPPGMSLPPAANAALTDPVVVGAIRELTQGAGTAALGALPIPPIAASMLGMLGFGVPLAANGVRTAGAPLGLLRDTPVRLAQTTQLPSSPAADGFAQRFDRVPTGVDEGGAQVVIERYESVGQPDRFEVYIAPTVTFEPTGTEDPWDLTSNIANAAGPDSGSMRSVELAMQQAGVTADSPVQFTGYSQGGATAARLVESGEWNAQGLVSFGGPTGQIGLPAEVPAVLVEHTDDLVPALGGAQSNTGAVLVQREVFADQPIPADLPVPAHQPQFYAQTAALMDVEQNPRLVAATARIDGFTGGATAAATTAYRFERAVPVEVSGADPSR